MYGLQNFIKRFFWLSRKDIEKDITKFGSLFSDPDPQNLMNPDPGQ